MRKLVVPIILATAMSAVFPLSAQAKLSCTELGHLVSDLDTYANAIEDVLLKDNTVAGIDESLSDEVHDLVQDVLVLAEIEGDLKMSMAANNLIESWNINDAHSYVQNSDELANRIDVLMIRDC